jgi:parvulin-like peptidyl-prolyl isomerase
LIPGGESSAPKHPKEKVPRSQTLKANWKLKTTLAAASIAAIAILGAQACQLGKTESYNILAAEEITAFLSTLPEPQQRMLATNANQRKAFITQFKQMFSLAQAAQAEGLHKSDEVIRRAMITADQILAQEGMKQNPDAEAYNEEEGKAYLAAHQAEFDADVKTIMAGSTQEPSPEQIEMMKGQWSEMKVRADKARKAGLDKSPGIQAALKFRRANILADAYSDKLEKDLKPSPEEIKKYVEEHPEADLEKIRQKAEGLYERVKNGEDFVSIAKQFTEDGSRDAGGDLGWFGRSRMDPEFEKVAFSLQKGQISELFKTQFGFHIVRVDDRRTVKKASTDGAPEEPQEEVQARHIFLSTQEADGVAQMLAQKKIQRAMEDATLRFPVTAPEDFTLNVGTMPPPAIDRNSGRIITPNQ